MDLENENQTNMEECSRDNNNVINGVTQDTQDTQDTSDTVTEVTKPDEPEKIEEEIDWKNMHASSFDEMGLSEDLLKGIYCYGFEKPSYIQQRAVMPLYKGKDIIAQSQSGTGKTGAFLIGSINKVKLDLNKTQILVLSPTRELSNQIFQVL